MREGSVKVHCITNPVTMQDTANILLAAGGSAIMAQAADEVEEITEKCSALLLNTGVPDPERLEACLLAGRRANVLQKPVVLDPVGAGAGWYRREAVGKLLKEIKFSIIRCNQAEAETLLSICKDREAKTAEADRRHDSKQAAFYGVESDASYSGDGLKELAKELARELSCTVFVSGSTDVISDGSCAEMISGGDPRMKRVTGGGCMLSALCALFCGAGFPPYEAAAAAGRLWKRTAEEAGLRTGENGGMGRFRMELFNALDLLCRKGLEKAAKETKKRICAEQLRLYAVTDRRWLHPGETLESVVEELVLNGVSCVQLREKKLPDKLMLEEARRLHEVCARYGVPLIINDRADIARLSGADGVHVGTSDMGVREARRYLGDKFIIGASVHTVEEALLAEAAGADYLGCGAVFGTDSKSDASKLPEGMLSKICRAVKIPVVAIGGINEENIAALSGRGAAGAAVISALFAAEEKAHAARKLRAAVSEWRREQMKTALSIAGSDCSGGAGIQADIKTMTALGVYAMTAITALTAQNTTGVFDTVEVTKEFLCAQLDCIFQDIPPDAVKIGMMPSGELMRVTAERLRHYGARHIVLDPVMISTSGCRLMQADAEAVLCDELIPLAELVTPNIPEAEALTGLKICTPADMEEAARTISTRYRCSVLLKGGHCVNDANDLLCRGGQLTWIRGERIDNPNTHGTGCTLSSAITAELALGYPLEEAVRRAKEYLSDALRDGLDLGKGAGPMNHACRIRQNK